MVRMIQRLGSAVWKAWLHNMLKFHINCLEKYSKIYLKFKHTHNISMKYINSLVVDKFIKYFMTFLKLIRICFDYPYEIVYYAIFQVLLHRLTACTRLPHPRSLCHWAGEVCSVITQSQGVPAWPSPDH